MEIFDTSFRDLSSDQYGRIVRAGTLPGRQSPMLPGNNCDALMEQSRTYNIDPRIGLAWCWAEGHFGSNPGLVAAPVFNFGGIKWANQPGAYDSGIPADTGGTYAGFPDVGRYFFELYRTLNNPHVGPFFRAGDLYGAARMYTFWPNPNAGANKVVQLIAYRQDYPPTVNRNRFRVANTDGAGLNLRAANNAGAVVVRLLREGTIVEARDRAWRPVRDPADGVAGWAAEQFLAPDGSRYRVINTDGASLNLRVNANTLAAVVKLLPDGTVVEARDRAWRAISDPADGMAGWVADQFLVPA